MKKRNLHTAILLFNMMLMLVTASVSAQQNIVFQEDGIDGFSILGRSEDAIILRHTISEINLNELIIKGVLLPSAPHSPNLPLSSRLLASPNGSSPELIILDFKQKTFNNIEVPPSMSLPLDSDTANTQLTKNQSVYESDAFYPENPFLLSEPLTIRGLQVVMISVTPFQYNPVKKQLKVFYDIELKIDFGKNEGVYGNEKYRSPEWDKILKDMVLNPEAIDDFDYYEKINKVRNRSHTGCEYLIVIPDNEDFRAAADSMSRFRNEQGILTEVVSLKEIGYNKPDSLKSYFRRAYQEWDVVPSAIMLLADYEIDSKKGIASFKMWDHPGGQQYEPYLSDNKLVDFNGDELPDIAISRLPAANKEQAELMIRKTISYERNPSSDAYYYSHPVTAMGFQQKLWFQLCSEVVGGYFRSKGKEPTQLNAIYEGVPGDVWSTGQNTASVTDYFGPEGMNYIPASMSHLTSWDASPARIANAIDKGSFMILHRDHGNFQNWSQPYFSVQNINQLNNEDLCFVISGNCQTGDFKYGNGESDCFAERFMRTENGAVGIIAPSEASYSYVNDTYIWGCHDYLFPDFMPSYGTDNQSFKRPNFANAAGKYFLKQSSWPYNASYKKVTCHLFHYFGDAFLQLNTELPQNLSVTHPDSINNYTDSIYIKADENSVVALSCDGKLLMAKAGTGLEELFLISSHPRASKIKVTVTKQNHYRYEGFINVKNEFSFEDDDNEEMQIYPNPVNNELHINNASCRNIVIYNSLGQKVYEKKSDSAEKQSLTIDFSRWDSGMYVLMIETDNEVILESVIHIL